jgi:hypothetical protein
MAGGVLGPLPRGVLGRRARARLRRGPPRCDARRRAAPRRDAWGGRRRRRLERGRHRRVGGELRRGRPRRAPACVPAIRPEDAHLFLQGAAQKLWDYESRAEPENLPDGRASGYRTADGRAHLLLAHYQNYRISGPDFDRLAAAPQLTFSSRANDSKVQTEYGHHQWVMSPYTDDGVRFVALAHSEWYGCLPFGADPVKGCAVGSNQVNSWVNGITVFVSDDGGATFRRAEPGAKSVLYGPPAPYPSWSFWTAPTPLNYGMFHPSNLIREGAHLYAFARYERRTADGASATSGLVLLRSSDPARAATWQAWSADGTFAAVTDPVATLPGTASHDHASITFNEALCAYLVVYWDYAAGGLYFTTTPSLAKPVLAPARRVEHQDTFLTYPGTSRAGLGPPNYASLVDTSTPGFNLVRSGTAPFLHYNSFDPSDVLRRNLYRVALRLSASAPPPELVPTGLFMVGSAIHFSNGAAYCSFPDWASYTRVTGRSDVKGLVTYPSIPPAMKNDGACAG